MPATPFLVAIYLAAAGLFHFGDQPALENDPNMTLEQEIAHEREADLVAANLANEWLEPDEVSPSVF